MNSGFTHIKRIAAIAALFLLLYSCEQIITVNLHDNPPDVVVESFITNGRGPFTVKLSKGQSYYNQSAFEGIENALVQMVDSPLTENLVEVGSGYYSTTKIRGNPSKTYSLNINIEGRKYGASVKLPPPIKIDTVYSGPSLFEKDSLNVFVEFQDPYGIENYYRLKLSRNGKVPADEYLLFTDAFSDGQRLWTPIYSHEFAYGDTVVVELDNLDRNSWRYLKGVGDIIHQGVNVQAPGNPPSNISGGALGYFGAWGKSTFKVIIKK